MVAKKKVSLCLTEDQEQTKLVVWLEKNNIDFFAIPNGGKRNLMEALKLKRTGVKSGIPDLCIPISLEPYHGLYIELKRVKGGIVSGTQTYWINKLRENGYKVEVCKGADAAKVVVSEYLKL